ncbi:hypothetical protein [Neptuniibacter sp. QD37_11]|uniref:hypothetical protein n=1 Tax=Neptuniibacter sp. QD37_11 TaxID=3398209 RepID=UPI0039F4DA4D
MTSGFTNKAQDLKIGQIVTYRNTPCNPETPMGRYTFIQGVEQFRSQSTGNQCVKCFRDVMVRDANELEVVLQEDWPKAIEQMVENDFFKESFDEMDVFQIGTEVTLKDFSPYVTVNDDGTPSNPCTTIKLPLFEIADGTVLLEQELNGCYVWNVAELELTDAAKVKLLLEVNQMQQEWIDAVPSDTVLPAMPGFDRDYVDATLSACK